MAPVNIAAATRVAVLSSPGCACSRWLRTICCRVSWAIWRRAVSTGLARASVNSTRPRRGSAELKPSTARTPARIRSTSVPPTASMTAWMAACTSAFISSATLS